MIYALLGLPGSSDQNRMHRLLYRRELPQVPLRQARCDRWSKRVLPSNLSILLRLHDSGTRLLNKSTRDTSNLA